MAASFPNAKKTFTAVVNGVTKLVASLFNTPDDEIEAIETFIGAMGCTSQSYTASIKDLMGSYRRGCECDYKSTSELYVRTGEIAIPDASGNLRLRKNTSDVTVAWANIDTGAEENSTIYYVFAVADAAATTFTVKVSKSSTAPTGLTFFKLIGTFYNDASGNILEVANLGRGFEFDNWVAKAESTTYAALTDGFVRIHKSSAGSGQLVSDSANPPMTIIGGFYTDGSNPFSGVYPVRKGDYWRVPSASTVYWMGQS